MSEHLWDEDEAKLEPAETNEPSRFESPKLLESQLADPNLRRVDRRKLVVAGGLVGLVLLGAGGVYASQRRGGTIVHATPRKELRKSAQVADYMRALDDGQQKPAPAKPCAGVIEDGVCYPPDDQLDQSVLTATAQPAPTDDSDPCPGCTPAQAIALEEARMKAAGDPEGRGQQYMGAGKPTYATNPKTGKAEVARGEEDEGDYTRLELAPIVMRTPTSTASSPARAASPDELQMPMMPMTPPAGGVQVPAGIREALEAAQNGGAGDPDRVKEDFAAKAPPLDSGNVPRELGECELTAGDVIHVSNLTAINTDVPARATITAMVSETVYCGASRQYVAIPAGARFTASANSRVAYGDSKIQVCMDQLRLPPSGAAPNGSVIATDCWAAADIGGMVGWDGEVDNHWPQTLASVALSALFSLGAASAAGNQEGWAPTLGQRAASQAGGQLHAAGQRVTQRELQRKPTIVRRSLQAGAVIVTRNQKMTPHVGIAMQIKKPRRRRQ